MVHPPPQSTARPLPSALPLQRADRCTIALFSDTHFWPDGGDFYGGDGNYQPLSHTPAILAALRSEIAAASPDLALHLGDLVCGGGTYAMPLPAYEQATDQVLDALRTLPCPTYALPGNHDCPPSGGPYTHVERALGIEHGCGFTVDTPFARLVLLNAQGHSPKQIDAARPADPIYGWVHEQELARLDATLADAGERPVILFIHQLLRPWVMARAWRDFYPVRNADAVLEVMARHGTVRAVFQGHAHMLDVHSAAVGNGSCTFVVVPSLIEYPLSWLHLTITAERLSWTMRPLPLPALLERVRVNGSDQSWRAGEPAWRDMAIALA